MQNMTSPSERPAPERCRDCGAIIAPRFIGAVGSPFGRWLCATICDACQDRRHERERQTARRAHAAALLAAANLPAQARGWSFETAAAKARALKTGADLAAWEKALIHCRTWPSGGRKGLYLMGPSGGGKTVLAWCILVDAIARDGRSGLFLPVTDLFDEMRKSWAQNSEARELVERARATRVLVLDEIGVDERLQPWMRVALFKLIDHRMGRRLPTIFTSNCQPGELAEKLGDEHGRIMNRIIGGTNGVFVDGESFRELENGESWLLR